ncbi:MAG: hypothetical protein ABW360_06705 [Phenylobacterium sp.]
MKTWAALALACLAAGAAAPTAAAPQPLFERQGPRLFLPPQPTTPLLTYDIRFPQDMEWPGDQWVRDRIAQRVFPERIVVQKIDGATRSLRVQATRYGMETLASRDMVVTRVGPEPPEPTCSSVFADVRLSKDAPVETEGPSVRGGAVCPFATEIQPHRQLLVEGLGQGGKRLFVALSDDPRWSIGESVTPQGTLKLEQMGRAAPASTYVQFRAVIDARLRRLRVWQIDDTGAARAIGEVAWRNVEREP